VTKSVGGVDAGLAGEITFYKLSALLLLKTDVLLDVRWLCVVKLLRNHLTGLVNSLCTSYYHEDHKELKST
jgi:hypothetical protein